MNIKNILLCILISALVSVNLIGLESINIKKPSIPDEGAVLTQFSFSFGGYIVPLYIDIERDSNDTKVHIDGMGVEFETLQPIQLLNDVQTLLHDNDVYSWNGFSGSDPMILDGEGFHLHAVYSDQTIITASGENYFPNNYSIVRNTLVDMVEPLVEQYWADFYSKPIIDTNIADFYLKCNHVGGDEISFECDIQTRRDIDDKVFFDAHIYSEAFEDGCFAFYGEVTNAPFEQLQKLVEQHNIAQWNGRSANDDDASLAPEYILRIDYSSDEYITISGRALPKVLAPFTLDAVQLIENYIIDNQADFGSHK